LKKITAKSLANKIWNNPRNIPDLSAEVIRITKKCLRVGDLRAFEKGTELLPKVKTELRKKIEEARNKGISPNFEFNPYDNNVLEVKSGFSAERKEKILKNLSRRSWKDFEDIVRKYLSYEGVTNVDFIGRSKEGGIDFFGILALDMLGINKPLTKMVRLRVIGQAKRWKGKIGDKEARAFSTHLKDIQEGKGRGWKKLPDWFKKLNFPFVTFFVTNSKFTKDAREYLDNVGVICVEGDQFADWIARTVIS